MTTLTRLSQNRNSLFALLIAGAGVMLIATSLYYVLRDPPAQADLNAIPVEVNRPAPQLALTDVQGNPSSLSDYRGQVVLVNLWATWCPPCKEEMPALETFYRRYKEDGFAVIAINDGDPTADVLQFVEDYGLTFPVWLDPKYIATEKAFKTMNLPSSFVIDRNGTIVLSWVGGINLKTLEKHVSPVIEE